MYKLCMRLTQIVSIQGGERRDGALDDVVVQRYLTWLPDATGARAWAWFRPRSVRAARVIRQIEFHACT